MSNWPTFLPWAGNLAGFLCLWGAMRANRKRRLVDDIPTSKTTGVFIGLVELKGTAESEEPFTSYLAQSPCVLYSWNVSEHWSRTVTEQYTDSQGRSQTRTRRESGWTTVASGGESAPFYLQDDHGVILVRPDGAEIEKTTIFNETCTPGDDLYYGKGPQTSVSDSDDRRLFTESAIPLHHKVYVLGRSRLREDMVAPEMAAHDEAPLYLVSVRDEDQISSGYGWSVYIWWAFGLFFSIIAWIVIAVQSRNSWHPVVDSSPIPPWIAAALLYLGATALAWVWMVYNSLITLRQRVEQGRSQIDVQHNRRHDLIPNLISTVQGYADHESEIHTSLAGLRSQLQATSEGKPGPDPHGFSSKLVILAEHYPQLKADEAFLKLQHQLSETENRIALARSYFNDVATQYNSRLQVVPERFVASVFNMKSRPLMETAEFERAPVQVKLSDI